MIIFDLDGTLADCTHRRHFVDPEYDKDAVYREADETKFGWFTSNGEKWKPDWDSFHQACDKDKAIQPVIEILDGIYFNTSERSKFLRNFQIWSGRSESCRDKTLWWLREYVLFDVITDEITLKMRPIKDYTPDDELKERWLDEALAEGKEIEYVFDDRPKVVRMWRRRGIFVFNCNQSDEEF